jgi:hypothetical protein
LHHQSLSGEVRRQAERDRDYRDNRRCIRHERLLPFDDGSGRPERIEGRGHPIQLSLTVQFVSASRIVKR